MAFAREQDVATEGQTDFTIPFPSINEDHVRVFEDGVQATNSPVGDNNFTIVNGGATARFNTGRSAGAVVIRDRDTSRSSRLVNYTIPSTLVEADLDNDSLQAFYMAQEAIDRAELSLGLDSIGTSWDADSKRIVNVSTPTSGTDAANKNYVDLAVTGTISPPIDVSIGGTGGTTQATARAGLGATTVGDAVFIAADSAAARTATGAAADSEVRKQGKETIWVPAAAMRPTVSNGCAALTDVETTAGRPDLPVLDFDATADEHAQFQVAFPTSWNEGTITFQAFWTTTATDTDGVAWGLQGVAASDNETLDVAYGTAVVVTDDAQSAAEELLVTAESASVTIAGTPAAGDLVTFRVFRDVSDANDDMTEDARLLGVKIFFTTNAATDA